MPSLPMLSIRSPSAVAAFWCVSLGLVGGAACASDSPAGGIADRAMTPMSRHMTMTQVRSSMAGMKMD